MHNYTFFFVCFLRRIDLPNIKCQWFNEFFIPFLLHCRDLYSFQVLPPLKILDQSWWMWYTSKQISRNNSYLPPNIYLKTIPFHFVSFIFHSIFQHSSRWLPSMHWNFKCHDIPNFEIPVQLFRKFTCDFLLVRLIITLLFEVKTCCSLLSNDFHN